MKRKYDYYILASDEGDTTFDCYNDAVSQYSKRISATLYGVNADDDTYTTILSK